MGAGMLGGGGCFITGLPLNKRESALKSYLLKLGKILKKIVLIETLFSCLW